LFPPVLVVARSYTSSVTSEAAAEQSVPPSAPQCDAALSQAFALLGKRWSGMILGSLMQGPAGFSEIRRALETISDSVLADRLVELTGAGLVLREVDEGPPVAVRYRLAESGVALVPVLRDLMDWARENL
jgi:DNA-binding HxlR family transcriptional regulator